MTRPRGARVAAATTPRDVLLFVPNLIGYARVSTQDQNPQLQLDALKGAGCEKIYVGEDSRAWRDRPELQAVA